MGISLWLRHEVFENGILYYPSWHNAGNQLNFRKIAELRDSLHQSSENGCITLHDWVSIASKHLQWTEEESESFWRLLFLLSPESARADNMAVEQRGRGDAQPLSAIILFLICHLEELSTRKEPMETWNAVWKDSSSPPQEHQSRSLSSSPLSPKSPRTTGLRERHTAHQKRVDFIKKNIQQVVALGISSVDYNGHSPRKSADSPPPAERESEETSETISAEELDCLTFLFSVGTDERHQASKLSALAPGFSSSEDRHTHREPLSTIVRWIRQNLRTNEVSCPPFHFPVVSLASSSHLQFEELTTGETAEKVKAETEAAELDRVESPVILTRQSRSTIVLHPEDVNEGELAEDKLVDVSVSYCEDCFIYILFPTRFVSVVACSNCTIVLGPTKLVTTVERATRVSLTCVTRQLSISNCLDSLFYSLTPFPPLVTGDSAGLHLGPLNLEGGYPHFEEQMRLVGLPVSLSPKEGQWRNARSICTQGDQPDIISLIKPQDLQRIAIPVIVNDDDFETTDDDFLSDEYALAQKEKAERVLSLQKRMTAETKGSQVRHTLEVALQGHFKEWLISTGNYRQIFDLVSMERNSTASNYSDSDHDLQL